MHHRANPQPQSAKKFLRTANLQPALGFSVLFAGSRGLLKSRTTKRGFHVLSQTHVSRDFPGQDLREPLGADRCRPQGPRKRLFGRCAARVRKTFRPGRLLQSHRFSRCPPKVPLERFAPDQSRLGILQYGPLLENDGGLEPGLGTRQRGHRSKGQIRGGPRGWRVGLYVRASRKDGRTRSVTQDCRVPRLLRPRHGENLGCPAGPRHYANAPGDRISLWPARPAPRQALRRSTESRDRVDSRY